MKKLIIILMLLLLTSCAATGKIPKPVEELKTEPTVEQKIIQEIPNVFFSIIRWL